jgi:hypothetical protein
MCSMRIFVGTRHTTAGSIYKDVKNFIRHSVEDVLVQGISVMVVQPWRTMN